jgi:hypothetical protein
MNVAVVPSQRHSSCFVPPARLPQARPEVTIQYELPAGRGGAGRCIRFPPPDRRAPPTTRTRTTRTCHRHPGRRRQTTASVPLPARGPLPCPRTLEWPRSVRRARSIGWQPGVACARIRTDCPRTPRTPASWPAAPGTARARGPRSFPPRGRGRSPAVGGELLELREPAPVFLCRLFLGSKERPEERLALGLPQPAPELECWFGGVPQPSEPIQRLLSK